MTQQCRIEEGHLMPDHVHMLVADPTEIFGFFLIGYETDSHHGAKAQDPRRARERCSSRVFRPE